MTRPTSSDALFSGLLAILISLLMGILVVGCLHERRLQESCRERGGVPIETMDHDIVCVPGLPKGQ